MIIWRPGRACSIRASLLFALCFAPVLALAQAAQDHPADYAPADVANGQRVYSSLCIICHGPTGNGVSGVDLRRGPIRRAPSDDALRALITTGIPTSGMPSFKLEPAELTGLVAFIRSGFDTAGEGGPSAMPGNAERGRAVVTGSGECLSCHRLGNEGGFAGPDLGEAGRTRAPGALLAALLDPTPVMLPINRPVRAITKSGAVLQGRRLNEDLYTVQIITNEGRLVSLIKSDLRAWDVGTTSTMPSYRDRLTPDQINDVVAFLASFKGGRP